MTLAEAIRCFEIFAIIQKKKNKKGKIIQEEVTLDDLKHGLDTMGKIGIRDMNEGLPLPACERLVFVIDEVLE